MHGVEWLGADPSLADAVGALKKCKGTSRAELIACARENGVPESYIAIFEDCKGTSSGDLLDCAIALTLPNPAGDVLQHCQGTSKDQLRECAKAGAKAAATAGCSPYGPYASYACGVAAENLAGPLFDGAVATYEWLFGKSDEERAVEEHNAKVAALAQWFKDYQAAANQIGNLWLGMKAAEIRAVRGVQEVAFYGGLPTPTDADVRTQFAMFGFGDCVGEYPDPNVQGCKPDVPNLPLRFTKLGQNPSTATIKQTATAYSNLTADWLAKLGDAKRRTVTMLIAQAAAEKAKAQSAGEGTVSSGGSSKKSGGGLLFLGLLAAGGAAYWGWRQGWLRA